MASAMDSLDQNLEHRIIGIVSRASIKTSILDFHSVPNPFSYAIPSSDPISHVAPHTNTSVYGVTSRVVLSEIRRRK